MVPEPAGAHEFRGWRRTRGVPIAPQSRPTTIPTGGPVCDCAPAVDVPGASPGGFSSREPARPPAVRTLRRRLREWMATRDLDEDLTDAVLLLADEAVTNAVEHAAGERGCTVEVVANTRGCGGGIAVMVRDDGVWRPQPEDRGYRGRGVTLMGRMADRSSISTSASGTTVRLCWALPSMN
ncbi:ATP-binding protein [Actinomycetospora sp. OC33-EN08]|uniref:ATP-binding protein n=1 Tax=Actinomycetospora aurantiaca TaxID=3129233 RepID=A0ABU8MXA0_9PSEU